jgi:hypothetical protein
VDVAVRSDGVHLARLHADLGRGAWMPAPPDSPRHVGYSQSTVLALPIEVAMVGVAVLELLVEPPIAG